MDPRKTLPMHFFKLYVIVAIAGIVGALAGAIAGGLIAAARCNGGLECLGVAFLGVGMGGILMESVVMSLAAHIGNQGRGNLLLTFLPTALLAVPIPVMLLVSFNPIVSVPLFMLQTWGCVKVQLATTAGPGWKRV